jgi:hypothetical protein
MMTAVPNFQYSSVPGATSYDFQIDDDASFAAPYWDVASASFTTSVANYCFPEQIERNYWWRIRARNASGPGPWSSAFRLLASTATKLATPVITGVEVRADSVILRWSPVPGATFYLPIMGGASALCVYSRTSFSLARSRVVFPVNVSVVAYNASVDSRRASARYDASGMLVAPPTITSFAPSSGAVGASVAITGTNLSGATVRFAGGVAGGVVASILSNTATQVVVNVPTGAVSGAMTVTTPFGTAVSAMPFTVLAPPTITSFTPSSGLVGTVVTISGTNFSGISSVQFGGVAATRITPLSSREIQVTAPAGASTGAITVTSPSGTATSATPFTVLVPPVITSFSPASGVAGTSVTINGTNLSGASSVLFGGVAGTIVSNTATQIVATVPIGAVTGAISVRTAAGTATSSAIFTVVAPAPSITEFTPTSGAVGTEVTINGANFVGVTAVRFGTVNVVSPTIVSASRITARVPTMPAGAVQISVVSSGGIARSAALFTVTEPSPSMLAAPVLMPSAISVTVPDALTRPLVSFNWGSVGSATRYRIEYASDMEFTNLNGGAVLRYTSFTNSIGVTWYNPRRVPYTIFWRVRAENSTMIGLWSATGTLIVNPAPSISALSPPAAAQGASLTVAVTGVGTNFATATSVLMRLSGRTISGEIVPGATATTMNVRFTIPTDAPIGDYDFVVSGAAPADLSVPFRVNAGADGLETEVLSGFNPRIHGFNFANGGGNWSISDYAGNDYTSTLYPTAIREAASAGRIGRGVYPPFDAFVAALDLRRDVPGLTSRRYPPFIDGSAFPSDASLLNPSLIKPDVIDDWLTWYAFPAPADDLAWGGSCYGFALASVLNFAGVPAYQFSGVRPFELPTTIPRLNDANLRFAIDAIQSNQPDRQESAYDASPNEAVRDMRRLLSKWRRAPALFSCF